MKKSILLIVSILTAVAAWSASPSGTLPVLYVNTANNAPITSKETYIKGTYWLDPMGDESIDALGSEESPLPLQIRGRGNYTWTLDKKPYRLKLDSKAKLMGMNKSKHFVLMAHADDNHGYLREPLAFRLSEMMGLAWTPKQKPVELVINGDYLGLYFLVENIRIAKDRVNIFDQEEEAETAGASSDVTGGWLVEVDNYRETNQITIREGNGNELWITHHSPEEVTQEQRSFLVKEMFNINAAAYSNDPESKQLGELVDIDALARFYVHSEIIENAEAYNGSWYLHRDRGADKKWVCGPVWDFGQTLNHAGKFVYIDAPWGCKLIQPMLNNNELRARVREVFTEFLASGQIYELFDYIDDFSKVIEAATKSDAARWPQFNRSDVRNQSSWVRDRVTDRVKWLGEQWGIPVETHVAGKGSNIYLRGTQTDWQALSEWEFVNSATPGVYDLKDVTFDADGMFKIADSPWRTTCNWGFRTKGPMADDTDQEVITGGDSKDVTFKAGHYDLIRLTDLDGRHGTLHAYRHYVDGVDNVAVDVEASAPVLVGNTLSSTVPFSVYTLAGVEVARDVKEVTLAPGFYIAAHQKYIVR